MLPESPETFMRNWENQSGGAKYGALNGKSPMKDTIKKEPVMIHHSKVKSENELKSNTPEKLRMFNNNSTNDIIEKINEGKEIYRNQYEDQDYIESLSNNNMMFIYDCGHCLSGNMKGNPKKINNVCPGCSTQQGKGSAIKWNGGSAGKLKANN